MFLYVDPPILDDKDDNQEFSITEHDKLGQILNKFKGKVMISGIIIQSSSECSFKTNQMSAAIRVVDIIGKSQGGFIVLVIVLQGNFHFAIMHFFFTIENSVVLDVLIAV